MTADRPDPVTVDALRTPAWERLLATARRSLERSGGELETSVSLSMPSEVERKLVTGLTGHHRPPGVKSVQIRLTALNAAVVAETGLSLVAALATLHGPVRNRPGERLTEERLRTEALRDAARRVGSHATEPWFVSWLEQLTTDGTLTRLGRRGDLDQLAWACSVLRLLPAADLSLPVLAERATGNTKALAHTPISTLVLRALAVRDATPVPATAAQRRERWEAVGVIVDDLASQVLVLGLRPAEDHMIARWLSDAADAGIPFRLTLHQLTTTPISLTAPDVFVCENPAVLRAAVGEWDNECAPLICTEGVPSGACHRLLARARGTIHWRGDFDWTGLRTTSDAAVRYQARPWRMSTQDYLTAIDAPSAQTELLRGAAAASPWDPDLATTMAARGRAVMEERLIPLLLSDLRQPPS